MTGLIASIAFILAAVLENVLPAWQLGGSVRWPVMLCVVMYYALNHSLGFALSVSLIAGVFVDAISDLPSGSSATIFCLLTLLISRYRDFIVIRSWLTHMAIGLVSGSVYMFFSFILITIRTGVVHAEILMVFLKILATGLAGMCLMPAFFWVVESLESMVQQQERSKKNEFDIANKI